MREHVRGDVQQPPAMAVAATCGLGRPRVETNEVAADAGPLELHLLAKEARARRHKLDEQDLIDIVPITDAIEVKIVHRAAHGSGRERAARSLLDVIEV